MVEQSIIEITSGLPVIHAGGLTGL